MFSDSRKSGSFVQVPTAATLVEANNAWRDFTRLYDGCLKKHEDDWIEKHIRGDIFEQWYRRVLKLKPITREEAKESYANRNRRNTIEAFIGDHDFKTTQYEVAIHRCARLVRALEFAVSRGSEWTYLTIEDACLLSSKV